MLPEKAGLVRLAKVSPAMPPPQTAMSQRMEWSGERSGLSCRALGGGVLASMDILTDWA